MATSSLPKQLQGLVWSKRLENLDLERDDAEIIHHVLRHGRVSDIAWLLTAYSPERIRHVFKTKPLAIYSRSALHFAKDTILNIRESLPNEHQYIQSFS